MFYLSYFNGREYFQPIYNIFTKPAGDTEIKNSMEIQRSIS